MRQSWLLSGVATFLALAPLEAQAQANSQNAVSVGALTLAGSSPDQPDRKPVFG